MSEPVPEDKVASLKTSRRNTVKHVGRSGRASESQEFAMGQSDTARRCAHGCGRESRRGGQECTRQPGWTWPAGGAPHRAVGDAPASSVRPAAAERRPSAGSASGANPCIPRPAQGEGGARGAAGSVHRRADHAHPRAMAQSADGRGGEHVTCSPHPAEKDSVSKETRLPAAQAHAPAGGPAAVRGPGLWPCLSLLCPLFPPPRHPPCHRAGPEGAPDPHAGS